MSRPHVAFRLSRYGRGTTFAASSGDVFHQCLTGTRIQWRRLERSQRIAPHLGGAFCGGFAAIVRPCTEVAPIRYERRVESIPVTLHRVSRSEEVSADSRFHDCLDSNLLG